MLWCVHYVGRNKLVMSHPNFLDKLLNLAHIYIVCHIKVLTFKTNRLFFWNVIFYRTIITPLYMCGTQTILNRLKQPKHFYSVYSHESVSAFDLNDHLLESDFPSLDNCVVTTNERGYVDSEACQTIASVSLNIPAANCPSMYHCKTSWLF